MCRIDSWLSTQNSDPEKKKTNIRMASLPVKTLVSVQIVVLLVGLVYVVEINGAAQREFDYFVLALQWPGTFCRRTHHCCSTNACCRG